ncbi:hypothetical protein [Mesobacillus subterraneus]|uniref:Uncharacterized protein n=1 Tax=Mesobacillus subterraneus TaxID=285983 RepID=A0A3R9E9D8_9BACI|nr:hypothetical protein [Mesobacillus subterraneus]RSD26876.1 hypothetical protein EJA10_13590 [Mesobacillus subterraneus]
MGKIKRRMQKPTVKKHGSEYLKMAFGDEYYFNEKKVNFTYAWKHPILTCFMGIKYIFPNFYMMTTHSYMKAYGWGLYTWVLYLQIVLLFNCSTIIGFFIHRKFPFEATSDGLAFLFAGPFLIMFTIFSACRLVIFILEVIRLFKEDSKLLYGLSAIMFYGVILMLAAGMVLGEK